MVLDGISVCISNKRKGGKVPPTDLSGIVIFTVF